MNMITSTLVVPHTSGSGEHRPADVFAQLDRVNPMYQHDQISSSETTQPSHAQAIDLMASDAGGVVSLQRLHSAVTEIFTALNEALRNERSKAAACLRRAEAILETVEQPTARAPATVSRGLAPWQIRSVLTYVDTNLDTPIRNQDLAAIARLSKFHFNVAFRKSVGHSPHEHIIRRRMERAQGLMLSTDKSLSEIAAECGLADQSHFTRLFRRFSGESPAAWRRARANPHRDS
jgi:AraC family transcriptional regulator